MYNGKYTTLSLTASELKDFIDTIAMLGVISGSTIKEIESAMILSYQTTKQFVILQDEMKLLVYYMPALLPLLRDKNMTCFLAVTSNNFLNLIIDNKPQFETEIAKYKYTQDRFLKVKENDTYKKILGIAEKPRGLLGRFLDLFIAN